MISGDVVDRSSDRCAGGVEVPFLTFVYSDIKTPPPAHILVDEARDADNMGSLSGRLTRNLFTTAKMGGYSC